MIYLMKTFFFYSDIDIEKDIKTLIESVESVNNLEKYKEFVIQQPSGMYLSKKFMGNNSEIKEYFNIKKRRKEI